MNFGNKILEFDNMDSTISHFGGSLSKHGIYTAISTGLKYKNMYFRYSKDIGDKDKIDVSNIRGRKPILMFDLESGLLEREFPRLTDASFALFGDKFHRSLISNTCHGRSKGIRTGKTFRFKLWKDNPKTLDEYDRRMKHHGKHIQTQNKELEQENQLPILQYTRGMKLVGLYSNSSEAAFCLGISKTGITGAATGKRKTYRGFVWRYDDDFRKDMNP